MKSWNEGAIHRLHCKRYWRRINRAIARAAKKKDKKDKQKTKCMPSLIKVYDESDFCCGGELPPLYKVDDGCVCEPQPDLIDIDDCVCKPMPDLIDIDDSACCCGTSVGCPDVRDSSLLAVREEMQDISDDELDHMISSAVCITIYHAILLIARQER